MNYISKEESLVAISERERKALKKALNLLSIAFSQN